jgi:hypothetical protein
MKISDMTSYPVARGVLRRAIESLRLNPAVVDTLTESALARIECGDTREHDVHVLLEARAEAMERMRNRSKKAS